MKISTDKEILDAIIIGYRKAVKERYQYDTLLEGYVIPDSFTEDRLDAFRDYFLEYIYPPPSKRNELNDAFDSLDAYLKKPNKLLPILLDSASLVFKYGRHLPKILKAGLRALKSFQTATAFENKLKDQVLALEFDAPFSTTDIYTLIKALPREEVEQFIIQNEALFETLKDRKLVKKVKEIVAHLMQKMQQRPEIYTIQQIQALALGQDIIEKGDALFESLSDNEQEQIFDTVIQIERVALDKVYKS